LCARYINYTKSIATTAMSWYAENDGVLDAAFDDGGVLWR
jgi:hypothetical protein